MCWIRLTSRNVRKMAVVVPLLPSAMKLRRLDYVFTGVCLSTGGGSASVHAGIPHPPEADPPGSRPPRERQPLLRTIRILLECILVIPNVSPVSSLMSSLCCPWCYPNVVHILSPHSCHPRLTRFHETLQDFTRIFFHLKIKAVYNNSAKTDKGSHH